MVQIPHCEASSIHDPSLNHRAIGRCSCFSWFILTVNIHKPSSNGQVSNPERPTAAGFWAFWAQLCPLELRMGSSQNGIEQLLNTISRYRPVKDDHLGMVLLKSLASLNLRCCSMDPYKSSSAARTSQSGIQLYRFVYIVVPTIYSDA